MGAAGVTGFGATALGAASRTGALMGAAALLGSAAVTMPLLIDKVRGQRLSHSARLSGEWPG